jgi:acetyltransferase-like isoleucine patch superfamily enzyme
MKLKSYYLALKMIFSKHRKYGPISYILGASLNYPKAPLAWAKGFPKPHLNLIGEANLGSIGLYAGTELQCAEFASLAIGDGTFLNHHTQVYANKSISIGRDCMISWNVLLSDKSDGYCTEGIHIDDRCWIGASCIILPGTQLGHDCIVGAGSIVQGKYPPYSKIVGEGYEIENIHD